MSQPFNRQAKVPVPGKLDATLGEFWAETPWDLFNKGVNLSAFERKRVYLNVPGSIRGRDFIDISTLTSADNDGDGRSVVAGDFRNTGQLDLVVRQVGGGPVILYENNFPTKHYLEVSLRGKPGLTTPTSNRLGIGARLVALVNGQQIVREQFPLNSYRSQMPNVVHFGLGDAPAVDRLSIVWPSGQRQELANLAADRHILIEEGNPSVQAIVPGQQMRP